MCFYVIYIQRLLLNVRYEQNRVNYDIRLHEAFKLVLAEHDVALSYDVLALQHLKCRQMLRMWVFFSGTVVFFLITVIFTTLAISRPRKIGSTSRSTSSSSRVATSNNTAACKVASHATANWIIEKKCDFFFFFFEKDFPLLVYKNFKEFYM